MFLNLKEAAQARVDDDVNHRPNGYSASTGSDIHFAVVGSPSSST